MNRVLILLLMIVSVFVFGQQDPQFSQNMFNKLANNPAYAGSEGGKDATESSSITESSRIGEAACEAESQ